MKITFYLIILKCVNKYGIFRNNKNIDKVSQNKFHNFSKQCCLFKGVNIVFKAYIFAFVFQIRVVVSFRTIALLLVLIDVRRFIYLVLRIKKTSTLRVFV